METAIVFLIDTYRLIEVGGRTDGHAQTEGMKDREKPRERERERE
jgi:hypothetical protein